jgi:sec-independent protein translocase protein TatB
LLVLLLAVVLIGPKQLPEVARGIAKVLAAFRRATADLRSAVSEEINARPEFRELSKIRDEISGDVNKLSSRARDYMQKEFQDEQKIAGSVERDVRKMGENFGKAVENAAAEQDISGPPAGDAKPAAHVAATSHAPWNVQYDKFYTTSPAAGDAPAAPSAEADSGAPAPTAATASPSESESPEDKYLKERERGPA